MVLMWKKLTGGLVTGALILGLLATPVYACDPNFQSELLLSFVYDPPFSPGPLLLPLTIFMMQPHSPFPDTLAEISGFSSIPAPEDPSPIDKFFCLLSFGAARFFAGEASSTNSLMGSVRLQDGGCRVSISRNTLAQGGWQTAIINISFPSLERVCFFQPTGKITFLDELDTSIQFSVALSWPPALLYHAKVWNRNGFFFNWTLKGDRTE